MNVSVIIPAYNREKTIRRCLNSVLSQTVAPYEIIVVDDGSVDGTVAIVEEIGNNIRLIKQNHKGAQAARNLGILNANGDYIAFLDSDDEWLPQMLEVEINTLLEHQGNYVVYSDCYIMNNSAKRWWRLPECGGDSYFSLLMQSGPMFQSMLAKKELFIKIGLLDENVVAMQEWETAIRLAKEAEFIHIKKPLFNYYLHEGETISKNPNKAVIGYEYIVKKHMSEIEKLCGEQVLYKHYKNLINLCIKNRNKRIFVFVFDILCIRVLMILKRLAKNG